MFSTIRPVAGMNHTIIHLSGVTFMMMEPLVAFGMRMDGLKSIANGAMIFVGTITGAGKMRDVDNPMLWADAVLYFENNILPSCIAQETEWQGGRWKYADECHRSETWNNWTDMLCKDGRISDWQYENWSQPSVCDG